MDFPVWPVRAQEESAETNITKFRLWVSFFLKIRSSLCNSEVSSRNWWLYYLLAINQDQFLWSRFHIYLSWCVHFHLFCTNDISFWKKKCDGRWTEQPQLASRAQPKHFYREIISVKTTTWPHSKTCSYFWKLSCMVKTANVSVRLLKPSKTV